ncbi:hypothetical protein BWD14_04335 [Leptospira santarosai]|uniref:Uncharacterized protein n=1 Tax=Leptospira santarosai TaxID=28183 RepID=A0AB73MRN9_9LEPT|nr:hypothetical protein BWD14_04335 [Leptospira santarosai]
MRRGYTSCFCLQRVPNPIERPLGSEIAKSRGAKAVGSLQSKDERPLGSEIAKSRGAKAVGSLQSKDERPLASEIAVDSGA